MSIEYWDWNLWRKVMQGQGKLVYRLKAKPVEVMQFTSNNEPGDINMNAICIWINQGRLNATFHAWHNGTNVFIPTLTGWIGAIVGEWVVKKANDTFIICGPDTFAENYEPVGHVDGQG